MPALGPTATSGLLPPLPTPVGQAQGFRRLLLQFSQIILVSGKVSSAWRCVKGPFISLLPRQGPGSPSCLSPLRGTTFPTMGTQPAWVQSPGLLQSVPLGTPSPHPSPGPPAPTHWPAGPGHGSPLGILPSKGVGALTVAHMARMEGKELGGGGQKETAKPPAVPSRDGTQGAFHECLPLALEGPQSCCRRFPRSQNSRESLCPARLILPGSPH